MADWTKEEEVFLEENYAELGSSGVAEALGRSVRSVKSKVTRMGLSIKEPVHRQKMRVAERYGAPFAEVIQSFADAGYSRKYTSKMIGVSVHIIDAEAPEVRWPTTGKSSWNRRKAEGKTKNPWVYESNRRHRTKAWYTVDGITDNVRGHALRLGVSESGIRQRLEAGYPPEVAFDPRPLREQRKEAEGQ